MDRKESPLSESEKVFVLKCAGIIKINGEEKLQACLQQTEVVGQGEAVLDTGGHGGGILAICRPKVGRFAKCVSSIGNVDVGQEATRPTRLWSK
jgi:predicted rRNA methylase YqxC with S4 and FtsJ domains